MKKLLRKLKSKAGESIGETLVALMIGAFALVMLAGAITTTTGIINTSSDKINGYFDDSNTKLVKMSGAQTGKSVTITEETGTGVNITVPVKYGKVTDLGSKNPVIAFQKAD